jgi:glutathione S-transferase
MSDSQLALEYLAEAFEPRLAPTDPAGWDQVTADAEASEDQLANAHERIGLAVDKLEAALAGSDWLAGGAYSIADINAFALVHALPQLTPELVSPARTPRLTAYLARIAERPAVKAALANGGPDA